MPHKYGYGFKPLPRELVFGGSLRDSTHSHCCRVCPNQRKFLKTCNIKDNCVLYSVFISMHSHSVCSPYLRPICSKPVASCIFDFLSMMHHLKEEDILFIMTKKLSFYLNPTEIINKKLPACVEL